MSYFSLEQLIDRLLEDESLVQGLPEPEAQMLLGWLIGLLEEASSREEAEEIRALGFKLAELAREHGTPVESLIELVETAWGEVTRPSEGDPPLTA